MKALVIDDHPVVLDELVSLLRASDLGLTVLQASGTEPGLTLLGAHPDVALILLDMAMPGLSGVEAIDVFRAALPTVAIVVVSGSGAAGDVRRALAHGARGYVPKASRPQTLLTALRLVLSGEIYVPEQILGLPETGRADKLTPRQLEILDALSAGQSNRDIAAGSGVSEKTVKAHVGAIFRTLGVVSRTQAAAGRARLHRP